jgi:hypothetical protein
MLKHSDIILTFNSYFRRELEQLLSVQRALEEKEVKVREKKSRNIARLQRKMAECKLSDSLVDSPKVKMCDAGTEKQDEALFEKPPSCFA